MTRARDLSTVLESVFDTSPIGMSLVDLEWRRVRVNNSFCQLLGRPRAELIGTHVNVGTHADDLDLDTADRERLLRGEIKSYQVQKRYVHAWGYDVWVLLTVSLIRDGRGKPQYAIAQVQNITEQKAREERLEHVVDHDFLTGVFNRRYFDRALEQELDRSRRYGSAGSILLVDLDHFKDVNDRLGHAAGDDVLKSVAAALKQHVRKTDVLARFGGDEFAILLPQTDELQAQHVADGLVKALRRETTSVGLQGVSVSASIGVARLEGGTAEQLLSHVDAAMYDAKKAGRDCFVYSPRPSQTETRPTGRQVEHARVRETFEANRLCLYGQPIVDLGTGETIQYELLLRVKTRPGEPPLPPATFLGTAERVGMIQSIDGWVVREAVKLLAASPEDRTTLNVNVSGRTIGSPEFVSLVEAVLDQYGVDPSRLVFELTETAAISNIAQAKLFAERMREMGCRIALDDFGSGFGSFQYLKSLPFDLLKISGEFVKDLTSGTIDQVVVKAIVGISREMGKKTVAEFVESAEMATFLRDNGVDCGQGFFLGVPQPVSDLLEAATIA